MTYPSQQNQYSQPPVAQVPMPSAAPLPLRRVAGVALLVSAGLAVCGSLATNVYTAYSSVGEGPSYTIVTTLWQTTYTGIVAVPDGEPGHNYVPGIPLMVGVALAVLAGVALLRTARYRGQGPRLWAVAAGGLMAGLTATDCLATEATHSRQGNFLGAAQLVVQYGPGMWLLMVAGLIAVGGAVAAALADRSWGPSLAGPAGPSSGDPIIYAIPADESPTPPHGFPAQPEPER